MHRLSSKKAKTESVKLNKVTETKEVREKHHKDAEKVLTAFSAKFLEKFGNLMNLDSLGKKSKSVMPGKTGSIDLTDLKGKNVEAVKEEAKEKEESGDDLSPEGLQKVKDSLHEMDPVDLFSKKPINRDNGFLNQLNYTWTEQIIEHANQDKPINIEDMGGLKREEGLEAKFKLLEEQYDAQPEGQKSLLWAGFKAYQSSVIKVQAIMWLQWLCEMLQTKQMSNVTHFLEDKSNHDMQYGAIQVGLLLLNLMVLQYAQNHDWAIGDELCYPLQKAIDALIARKMLKLNTATTKNYDGGQINSVKGSSHRLTWFFKEISGFAMTPI